MDGKELNRLTERFADLRDVRPRGEAWAPIQQGMRAMVISEGYSPDQIIGCMEAINGWGVAWTINTVRRWIADFAAGKMPSGNGGRQHPGMDNATEITRLMEQEGMDYAEASRAARGLS